MSVFAEVDIVTKNYHAARIHHVGQAAEAVELGRNIALNIPSIYFFAQAVERMRCAAASQCKIPKGRSRAGIWLAADYFTLFRFMHRRIAANDFTMSHIEYSV